MSYVHQLATGGVPLDIWWSRRDRIVVDQAHQSGSLLAAIRHLNPVAPVTADVGVWRHSFEMRSTALLPVALESFGLLTGPRAHWPRSVHVLAAVTL